MGNSSSSSSSRRKSNSAPARKPVENACRYCCSAIDVKISAICARCGANNIIINNDDDDDEDDHERKEVMAPPRMGYNPLRVASDGSLAEPRNDDDDGGGGGPPALQYVSLLPFIETLPADCSTDNEWYEQYIQPHFADRAVSLSYGDHIHIREVEWRVVGAFPITGRTAPGITEFRCYGDALSGSRVLQKLRIVPTQSSSLLMRPRADTMFAEYIRPYFRGKNRHVYLGECFTSNGMQFKVMRCEPADGRVTSATQIYTDAPPVNDVVTLHLLPISETIPNRDKLLSDEEMKRKYVIPHFRGRFQYVSSGDEISIDGVDFKVMSCSPPDGGLVTGDTFISATGQPLTYDDVKRQQMEQDEILARQLQQQESGGLFPFHHIRRHPAGNPQASSSSSITPGGPQQSTVTITQQRRGQQPVVVRNFNEPFALLPLLLQGLMEQRGGGGIVIDGGSGSGGVDPADLESLPTRTFQGWGTSMSDEEKNDELISCRVCLSEYEIGDELRTLPCFHSYHRECIDRWLSSNRKCPICKHPIC